MRISISIFPVHVGRPTVCVRQLSEEALEGGTAGHRHKCIEADDKPLAAPQQAAPAPPADAAAQTAGGGGGGAVSGDECAIYLDTLQQPQTMPCPVLEPLRAANRVLCRSQSAVKITSKVAVEH